MCTRLLPAFLYNFLEIQDLYIADFADDRFLNDFMGNKFHGFRIFCAELRKLRPAKM